MFAASKLSKLTTKLGNIFSFKHPIQLIGWGWDIQGEWQGEIVGEIVGGECPAPISNISGKFPESFRKVSWSVFDKKIDGSFAAQTAIF